MDVFQNSQKFWIRYESFPELAEVPGRYTHVVPVPRVLWHGHTELDVSFVDGYEGTELTEVPVRVIPGKILRVWFCTYPTEHNLGQFRL